MIKVEVEEKKSTCPNCCAKLSYTTEDEKISHCRRYMKISCPRCQAEVLTTKLLAWYNG